MLAIVAAMPALAGCSFVANARTSSNSTCDPSYGPAVADTVGAVVFVSAGLYTRATVKPEMPCGIPCFDKEVRIVGAAAIGVGIGNAVSALFGYANAPSCRRKRAAPRDAAPLAPIVVPRIRSKQEERADEQADDQRARHDDAVRLTRAAAAAALGNDCAVARQLSAQVRDLDPEVHANGFLRDDAIKACLAQQPIEEQVEP